MQKPDLHLLGQPLPDWTPAPHPDFTILPGRHCLLEPLAADRHAAELFAAFQGRDSLWDYMGNGPFGSEVDFTAWVKSVERLRDPIFFAVIDRASGQALGILSLMRIDPMNGVIEVGNIAFSPRLQRTIAATEAIHLVMKHIFALGYRRFEWKCNALNLPSRRAAERFGFSYEGLFRQAIVVKGRNRDTAWFAMTDGDWAALAPVYDRWLSPDNFDASGRQKGSLSTLTRPLLKTRDPEMVA